MTSGKLIVFEGLDGSGQSTQAALLTERLKKNGEYAHLTKEPTNNLIGGLIRAALTNVWQPSGQVMQLLYAADRGHHLEREIEPALNKGYAVICDRYFYSSLAYGSLDINKEWLKEINRLYRRPDLTLYLKVRQETSLKRIQADRFELELFEEEQKLAKVAAAYDALFATEPGVCIIDGEQTVEAIHEEIYLYYRRLFA